MEKNDKIIEQKEVGIKEKCTYKDHKTIFGKIWHFLWHDNSIWSWIVNLIIIFIIVKWVFFPLMTLATGSQVPLVVIESESMEHNGRIEEWWTNYGKWYEEKGINFVEFENWGFKNGMNIGDMVLVYGRGSYKEGEIIIFNAQKSKPIIHRIVIINEDGTFQTKGDHNFGQDPTYELKVEEKEILGKALVRIPYIGWIKLFFTKILFNIK